MERAAENARQRAAESLVRLLENGPRGHFAEPRPAAARG
jgi:hypothetical protein